MYNFIINPKTNRKVKLTSKLGKKILLNYINLVGGATKSTNFNKIFKSFQDDDCLHLSFFQRRVRHAIKFKDIPLEYRNNETQLIPLLKVIVENYGQLSYDFIKYIPENVLDNKEIIKNILEFDTEILGYVSKRLKNDISFYKELINEFGKDYILSIIPFLEISNNSSFIVYLINRFGGNVLEYASNRIKDNKDIAIKALQDNPQSFEFVSKRLKDNIPFIMYIYNNLGVTRRTIDEHASNRINRILLDSSSFTERDNIKSVISGKNKSA